MLNPTLATALRHPHVYLIDDETDLLESMPELLDQGQKAELFSSAESFLKSTDLNSFGCVVVDHGLPGMNGVELIETLKTKQSTLSTILITGAADVGLVVTAFEHGITAFLEKPLSAICLRSKVKLGIDASRDAFSERSRAHSVKQRAKRLTPRETEVLTLLVDGVHSKLIAKRLGMAYNTVRVHRANVLSKMRVRSVIELLNVVKVW